VKFKFLGDPVTPIEGRPHHFKLNSCEVEADSYEEALAKAQVLFGEHKIWSGFNTERLVLDENDQ
jgi:hypothetical protein